MESNLTPEQGTGLYEPELFFSLLAREVARARRYARPLSLLVGRQSSDCPVGAEVVSERWMSLAREVDFGSRLEDRSWVVALPETDRAGASVAAERFRRDWKERCKAELWFGVVTFPHHGQTGPELVAAARTLAEQALRPVAVAEFPGSTRVGF